MLATGTLLIAIALLSLAGLAPVFRSNDPPRWTRRRWLAELVTLAIVGGVAFGLACLGAGAVAALETGIGGRDLGLIALVLSVSAISWRRLRARAPRPAAEADERRHAEAPAIRPAHGDRVAGTLEGAAASTRGPARPPRAA